MSFAQPWVCPIQRGKARGKTEFGAKLHISLVSGYTRMERLSFEAYNEADDFFHILERYKTRYGAYPVRIFADRIYRNRETLKFCKEYNIRLTDPALGRPPKDKSFSREQNRKEYTDILYHCVESKTIVNIANKHRLCLEHTFQRIGGVLFCSSRGDNTHIMRFIFISIR